AAYEGLACLMRGALEALRGGGISVNDAMLIGGGAQSETLNQILADVLEIPISVPRTSEYVARGAARQAAVVAGIPENTNSWSPDITQTYKPRENKSVWERYRAVSESIRKSYPTFRPESA
ncbi:FGGY-family carbohydrate kinase, partial [Actinotignum timonense]